MAASSTMALMRLIQGLVIMVLWVVALSAVP